MARSICIICPECIKDNQVKEYNERLESENQPTNEEFVEEDLEQVARKPRTVVQLNGWIEYAYHILDNHPDSERVEWAKSCLELAGKSLDKTVKVKKTTNVPKKNDDAIKLIPKNEDEKYANDLKVISQDLDEELKPYISKGNEPIKRSKPTLLDGLAKTVGKFKSLRITTR